MQELLSNPFFIGLIAGLLVALIVFLNFAGKTKELKIDNKKLKNHLHTKMEIESKASLEREKKLEKLRIENENLRISLKTLRNKPGRAELELLEIYQKALDVMFQKAPGFAPAWQITLEEAKEEIQKYHKGFRPLLRKIFKSGSSNQSLRQLKDGSNIKDFID